MKQLSGKGLRWTKHICASEGSIFNWIIPAHILGAAGEGQQVEECKVHEVGTGNDQVTFRFSACNV